MKKVKKGCCTHENLIKPQITRVIDIKYYIVLIRILAKQITRPLNCFDPKPESKALFRPPFRHRICRQIIKIN